MPGSHREPPFLLPRNHPPRNAGPLSGLGEALWPGAHSPSPVLTAELPGTPISGCAVQTPLPKHPSYPVRHTRSPQPSFLPEHPRPHNGPLSSASPPAPALPAPGPIQQREVKVPRRTWCQPLSWPILPSPGSSRAPSRSLRRVYDGISIRVRGALAAQAWDGGPRRMPSARPYGP